MNKENDLMAICTRKDDNNPPATVGIWVPCTACQHDVWLSDTTMTTMKERHPEVDLVKNPPKPFCMPCGLKEISKLEDPSFMMPGKSQITEIEKVLKGDAEQG